MMENGICTACGCMCDDIGFRVEGGRIVEARRACPLGEEWFAQALGEEGPPARVNGRSVPLEEGVEAAGRLLVQARSPLVYGLRDASTEAQELAVSIADHLGATVDTVAATASRRAWISALQRRGLVTATLGEVKNRADLILLWHVTPETSHPRFLERFVNVEGLYTSRERTIIRVHAVPPDVPGARDLHVPPEQTFETLWALRAVLQNGGFPTGGLREAVKGTAALRPREWSELAATLTGCRYGAWIYDPDSSATGDVGIAQGVLGVVRALNRHVPFAAVPLGGRGNGAGAESVLTAQTGYPFAVSFAAGYPRFGPDEFDAAGVLERGEVDAALIVGCDPVEELGGRATTALGQIPTVVVGHRATEPGAHAPIALRTATYGIDAPATVYRMDGRALHARAPVSSPWPSDAEVLARLLDRVLTLRTGDEEET